MRKEDAIKLSEQAVSELAEALEAGKSEQLLSYLGFIGKFHNYSIGNCMLIASQRPSATYVAGFSAWKKLGRTVKKGEKGICILAPMIQKEEDSQDKEKKVFGFRAVHVFDIAQTEGEEIPEFCRVTGDPGDKLDKLCHVVSYHGIEVTYEKHLGGADGLSKGGKIALLDSLFPAAKFATLTHELAHELLHRGSDRSEFSKVVKELEAEATAYVVVKAIGLEDGLRQSADYIQLYSGDKEQLLKSLDRICSVASQILVDLNVAEHVALQGATAT